MKKQIFVELMNTILQSIENGNKVYEAGIDITSYESPHLECQDILGRQVFGDEGWEIIQTYIFEDHPEIPPKDIYALYKYLVDNEHIKEV